MTQIHGSNYYFYFRFCAFYCCKFLAFLDYLLSISIILSKKSSSCLHSNLILHGWRDTINIHSVNSFVIFVSFLYLPHLVSTCPCSCPGLHIKLFNDYQGSRIPLNLAGKVLLKSKDLKHFMLKGEKLNRLERLLQTDCV